MNNNITGILYQSNILCQQINYYIIENNYINFINEKVVGVNFKKTIIEKLKGFIKILKDIWEKVKYFFTEYIPKKWKALKDKINKKKENNDESKGKKQTIKTYNLNEIINKYKLLVNLFDNIEDNFKEGEDVKEDNIKSGIEKDMENSEKYYNTIKENGYTEEYDIDDLNDIINKCYSESPNISKLSRLIKEKEKRLEKYAKESAEVKGKPEISEDSKKDLEKYAIEMSQEIKIVIKYQSEILNLIKKYNDLMYTEIERILKPNEFEFVSFENQELEKAIKNKDKLWLKAALINTIWNDPSLKHGEVNRLISIIKSKLPDFFEEEKAQLNEYREADKNKWNQDYFTDLTYWFRENPALSRLNYIFRVGKEINK